MSQSSLIDNPNQNQIDNQNRNQNQNQNDFYGWQLLYCTIRNSIRKKSDLLIALAHFLITKQYNLRIVDADADPIQGKGKQYPEQLTGSNRNDIDEANNNKIGLNGSELLPENWNRDDQKYLLHYMDEVNHRYILLAKLTRKDLVINLQNWTSKRMSITCLQPNVLVRSTHDSNLSNCIPEAKDILLHMRKDLVDPVVRGTRKTNPIKASSATKLSTDVNDINRQTVDGTTNNDDSQTELLYSVKSDSDEESVLTKSATTMAVYRSLKSVTSLDSL